MLGIPVVDDQRDAVVVRALLGRAPLAELVGCRADCAVTFASGPLHLEPAFATLPPADWIVVDGGIEAELVALDQVPHAGKRLADLVVMLGIFVSMRSSFLEKSTGKVREQKNPADCWGTGSVRVCYSNARIALLHWAKRADWLTRQGTFFHLPGMASMNRERKQPAPGTE